MEDYAIGQSLILQPNFSFQKLDAVVSRLGWQETDALSMQSAPLQQGEPEFASWTWQGQKPILIYSFNPIANLRVLDVASLPPALRGQLAQQLTLLNDHDINDLLFAEQARERLLALWAMQETERVDLIPQAHRLSHDPDHTVAELGQRVEERLQQAVESRESLAMSLVQLAQVAESVVRMLDNPAGTAALKPTREELGKLFDPSLTDELQKQVEQAYFRAPVANPGGDYPELKVHAVNAGLLRWSNEFSRKFPQGYRNIAGWMQPQWMWITWQWHSGLDDTEGATTTGVSYDGLVWIETRWVWLPKAFRMVSAAIRNAAAPAILQ